MISPHQWARGHLLFHKHLNLKLTSMGKGSPFIPQAFKLEIKNNAKSNL